MGSMRQHREALSVSMPQTPLVQCGDFQPPPYSLTVNPTPGRARSPSPRQMRTKNSQGPHFAIPQHPQPMIPTAFSHLQSLHDSPLNSAKSSLPLRASSLCFLTNRSLLHLKALPKYQLSCHPGALNKPLSPQRAALLLGTSQPQDPLSTLYLLAASLLSSPFRVLFLLFPALRPAAPSKEAT